jgi:ribonuclease HI
VLLSLICRRNCEAQIKGFPNASHKKFVSRRDAQEFVNGAGASNTPHSEEDSPKSASGSKIGGQKRLFVEIEDESGWDVVYSDGACKGNGKVGSVAGLGIWWGEGDARFVMGCFQLINLKSVSGRNIAERCPGEQTNNRAELIVSQHLHINIVNVINVMQAILRVLETTPFSKKPLLIKTDSQYSINCE